MFGKLFGSTSKSNTPAKSDTQAETQADAQADAPTLTITPQHGIDELLAIVEQGRAHDPLIGANVGSKYILARLMQAMQDESGNAHLQSLFCALGALAGYACQDSLRELAAEKGIAEKDMFMIVQDRDGKQYFFGDALNGLLVESDLSVWRFIVQAADHVGATQFPDLGELFKHTADTLGSDAFGIPRTAEPHQAQHTPLHYLQTLWPALAPDAKRFCDSPTELPILFAGSIQELILMSKDVIDPNLPPLIVMESAVPMAKVDLPNS